jgi:hypothetical protein
MAAEATLSAVAPSPTQLAWRARVERVLRVAAPGLDLLLALGDRASRIADREPPGPVLPAGGGALERRGRRPGERAGVLAEPR